ncbi:MAG: cytoplasmic protein, partial [Clostridium sp.]|nr:cytoplasmic protein [Clostridium sp.]
KGKWKDSIIEKILPVELQSGDDRVEVPEGADLSCVPDSHPILAGLPAEWP